MKIFSLPSLLTNYFFPAICPLCRKEIIQEKDSLCGECSKLLIKNQSSLVCPCCGSRLDTVLDLCSKCIIEDAYTWKSAICVFEMNKDMHDAILNFKYKNHIELYPFFASAASDTISSKQLKFDIVTSVPLHPLKFLMRGYNQSGLIAKSIASTINTPYKKLLLRKKFTRTQTRLSAENRRKNLKDVFLAKNREIIKRKDILLVDDIFTTGSTLRSAAKTLAENGAQKVTILVLARR